MEAGAEAKVEARAEGTTCGGGSNQVPHMLPPVVKVARVEGRKAGETRVEARKLETPEAARAPVVPEALEAATRAAMRGVAAVRLSREKIVSWCRSILTSISIVWGRIEIP
jgi:hypothetical protein